jgi:hypothetical protein
MKILFGDISSKVGREDIFKQVIGNVYMELVIIIELEQ